MLNGQFEDDSYQQLKGNKNIVGMCMLCILCLFSFPHFSQLYSSDDDELLYSISFSAMSKKK